MERKEVEAFLKDKGFVKLGKIKRDLYLCSFGFVEIRVVDGETYIEHIVNKRIKVEG